LFLVDFWFINKSMDTTKRDIGKRLEQIRDSLNLTQEEMGEKLGKGKGSISKYENGDAAAPISTLLKYAELGKVALDWLFAGKEPADTDKEIDNPSIVSEPETGYSPEIELLVKITKDNPLIKLIIPGMAELTDDEQFELYKMHKEIKARREGQRQRCP